MGSDSAVCPVPEWRSRVMYVPQRPAVDSGTPNDFYSMICAYKAQKDNEGLRPQNVAYDWDIPEEHWDRTWNELSGGEIQRIGAFPLICFY